MIKTLIHVVVALAFIFNIHVEILIDVVINRNVTFNYSQLEKSRLSIMKFVVIFSRKMILKIGLTITIKLIYINI